MNLLIVSAYNIKSYSRAIMLDQLAIHLESKQADDKIYYLNCSNSFDACYFNFEGEPGLCFSCRINANRSLKLVGKDGYIPLRFDDILQKEDMAKAESYFLENPLVDFNTTYDNFDIGESLLSVYISNTRNRDIQAANQSNYISKAKIYSLALYLALVRFLKGNKINKVLSFNGRQDYKRAVLRASQTVGIDCINFERTRPGGYIEYYENALPHNIHLRTSWIEKGWALTEFSIEEKKSLGEQFFKDKRAGMAIVDKSYSQYQKKGFVPAEFHSDKPVIVLFTSSDDEYAAVGNEYRNPYFSDQLEGIQYVASLVGKHFPDKSLIIRMHPNLQGLKYDYVVGVSDLDGVYPNVRVIPSESDVDSYALLDMATKVIVFGSSIGIEANYWKKPVILLGKSFYWFLDVAYIPTDKSEIFDLLKNDLPPKEQLGALKYGFYALHGGIKSKYYDQKTPASTPSFKSIKLNDYDFFTKLVARGISIIYKVFGIKLKLKWIK